MIWEVAVKASIGKLEPIPDLLERLESAGVRSLAITGAHAAAVLELPLLHRDPFDRLLVAQARLERLPLVTADAGLADYDVEVVW